MISLNDIQHALNDNRREHTEYLAQEAMRLTRQYFGRAVSLYAPLYLSNFCSSHCTYCGFHSHNPIERIKLTPEQYDREMHHLHAQGIRNILLLTGESYKHTPVEYLAAAAQKATSRFQGIALEVHPMKTEEYQALHFAGVDGIAVYQETYDQKRYAQVHLSGYKKDYVFRRQTPERAAQGGMRQISMGILLGLSSNVAQDVYDLFVHLREMEKSFPGVEYSLSFPRLRTIKSKDYAQCDIDDITFTKILCLARLAFPRVGINLSTREHAQLRDLLVDVCVTRMSAGSNTSVGGYALLESDKQDPQFDIKDSRSVQEIVQMLRQKNVDPVFTDWRTIENRP